MIIADYVFLDEGSGETSEPLIIPPQATELIVQVTSWGDQTDIYFEGIVDPLMEGNSYGLAIISLSVHEEMPNIETGGLYAVNVSGIKQIVACNSGSVSEARVYGVLVDTPPTKAISFKPVE